MIRPECLSKPTDPVPKVAKTRTTRLWSELDNTLSHQPGNVGSAAALVAGTTVGAGILALPAVTRDSGFLASSAALTGFCVWSIATGLLIAEVNLATLCELGRGSGISLASSARRTLGKSGAVSVTVTYALLHYTLLVAYTAKAGQILASSVGTPEAFGDVSFVATLGLLCYAAPGPLLDRVNNVLVALVIGTFLALLGTVLPGLTVDNLSENHWEALPAALPVIALAFVYQNVVPVVVSNLEGDATKIRQAITLGVGIPWLMFILWDAAILGTSQDGFLAKGADPLVVLRTEGPLISALVDSFSFLAVATSFIGFVLGLLDFFADVLDLPTGSKTPASIALTLLPPLACALSFPGIFFKALDFAGTYGVLVLFGLIPVAMAWSERDSVKNSGSKGLFPAPSMVPGGSSVLLLLGSIAAGVIVDQIL